MNRVALLHSGGKDSVLALAALRCDPAIDAVTLITTFTEGDDRVTMHRVRRPLIEAQAASLRCELTAVHVPHGASNVIYEHAMNRAVASLRDTGIETIATGDLHLDSIRAYREAWLARLGMRALFPLWGRPPSTIVREFIEGQYRAIAICIDHTRMRPESVGREMNKAWFDALLPGVDPSGEGGEYHSFVHDGPGFAFPIPIASQAIHRDDRFSFADLEPGHCSTCAQCSAPFTCGAEIRTAHCWCMTAPPVALDQDQATCICPRCLARRKAPAA